MRTRSRERGSRFSFPLFGSAPAGMLSDAYRQKRGIFAIFPHYLLYIHIASKNMRYDENGMRCVAGVCLSNACATACQRILLKATPHKEHLTTLHAICLQIFRHISQKCS